MSTYKAGTEPAAPRRAAPRRQARGGGLLFISRKFPGRGLVKNSSSSAVPSSFPTPTPTPPPAPPPAPAAYGVRRRRNFETFPPRNSRKRALLLRTRGVINARKHLIHRLFFRPQQIPCL
ncbi:hypothetical protein R5R35_009585 [Gryllus longicercus]|uniref:Uncharacterized protein n=1 Tax=Gryllus longicercus TaxID=2509291 RepID=A0AAN9VIH7_9ORTH